MIHLFRHTACWTKDTIMNHRTNSVADFGAHGVSARWTRTVAMVVTLFGAVGCTEPISNDRNDLQGRNDIPAEDGFVNPLSGITGTTESNDGDGYYSALDWSLPHPDYPVSKPHHCGEDWNYESGGSADYGEPVYATANGKVVSVGGHGTGWGKIVMIKHHIPTAAHVDYVYITSVYAHLESFSVMTGETVTRGQQIGTIGDADGDYKGAAHLHFEMRWDEDLGPTANQGYHCENEESGTFDPTDFIDDHPPGWSA
jgi:murein DD-endopeptidase MepM/ murein hydrolase activator NlpD